MRSFEMDENFNKDLNEFEEELRKAASKDERENMKFTKDFLERMKSESNFHELDRKRNIRIFYFKLSMFILFIVIITSGFNELIRNCNKPQKGSTITPEPSSTLITKNLYIIGLKPINNNIIIDKIKSLLDSSLDYNAKLYNIQNLTPTNIKIDRLTLEKLQFEPIDWKDVGTLLKTVFYDIPRDDDAYNKVILIGNFPEKNNNLIKKSLFMNDQDFKQLIKSQSIELVHMIENDITDLSLSFRDKINNLSKDFKKENIKNIIKYSQIKI